MRNRRLRQLVSLLLCCTTLAAGCTPTQPFYFKEDGDLSHYVGVATDVEFPDVDSCPLTEVEAAQAPLTLANAENFKIWDLTLEEVTRIMLANSQVIRQLGGRVSDQGSNIALTTPATLTGGGANAATTYDPALVDSGYGGNTGSQFSGVGTEAALSEFDAQLDGSLTWRKNDRPQNVGGFGANIFARAFNQETGASSVGLSKTSATGSTFSLRNNINYDQNNNLTRGAPSDWFTNIEAGVSHPFLQGGGVQYNRIAGPRTFQEYNGGFADQFDGVLIARIRYDISLADFENAVRQQMRDVEDAYWELYFAYRDLEARKSGRDSALATWQRVKELERVGGEGGEADKEAQARSQYYLFRGQVETALTTLFRQENRLRYMMGLAVSDGRLIRPIDEPTTAHVTFDWSIIHTEALTRRVELRKQKWQIKRRELELIAARNQMLPRLDGTGTYRWLGAGDDLIAAQRNGIPPFNPGSNAFESLTSGDFQEWELGMQFSMPLGFRRGLATVRNHQLLLAHERAILQDMELEVSHQMGDAVRDIDLNYGVSQTNFNRRASAEDEVEAVEAIYDVGKTTLDQLLDAQRRRSEAESAYYRSLVDYNRSIMRLHFNKGSLLEYNGVLLAEGPWPGKAYFDAMRRARQRDASLYMNYGFTRPGVVSRGPIPSMGAGADGGTFQGPVVGEPAEALPTTPLGPNGPIDNSPQSPAEGSEIMPPPGAMMPMTPESANVISAVSVVPPTVQPAVSTLGDLVNPAAQHAGAAVAINQQPPTTPLGLTNTNPFVQNPFSGPPASAAVGGPGVVPVAHEASTTYSPAQAPAMNPVGPTR